MPGRISELTAGTPPYAAASLVEIAVPNGGAPTGFDTRKAPVTDLLSGSPVYSSYNGNGVIPPSTAAAGWAISANYSGANEVEFWNTVNGSSGFAWRQKTGASAEVSIAQLSGNATYGLFTLYGVSTVTFLYNDAITGSVGTQNAVPFGIYSNNIEAIHIDTSQHSTFNGDGITLNGSTSGGITIKTPAVAGSNTITIPAVTGTLATLAGTETLSGKTISAPVFSGTATGTYTLGGTPTLSGGTLSGTTTLPGTQNQITSTGRILLGNTSAVVLDGFTSSQVSLRIGENGAGGPILGLMQFNNSVNAAFFVFAKSRGTAAAAAAVQSGDNLANWYFDGDDGSTNGTIGVRAAEYYVKVDGTVSTGIVPGRHAWSTMNGAGVRAERMSLYSGGDFRQGTGSALATTATDGFLLIATCAGAPTGVPTNAGAGQIPMIFDKTNNKLYAYNGGWKASGAFA